MESETFLILEYRFYNQPLTTSTIGQHMYQKCAHKQVKTKENYFWQAIMGRIIWRIHTLTSYSLSE